MKKTSLPNLLVRVKTVTWWLKPANLTLSLFQLLVLLLPVQLGYHFWPSWSHVYGIRIDYLSPTLYLTDLLILALLVSSPLSSVRFSKLSPRPLLLSFAFLLFVALNINLSQLPFLTLFKWLKFFELIALSLFVSAHRSQIIPSLPRPLSFALCYTALIAVFQLLFQSSLNGPFYYLGERSFTSSTPAIALFTFSNHRLLRPYATFPHPNALSAFALISLLILIFTRSKSLLNRLAIVAAVFLIIISFSQTVWFTALILFFLNHYRRLLLCPLSLRLVLFCLVIFSLLLPLLAPALLKHHFFLFGYSFQQRLEFSAAAGVIFMRSPWLGVGLGNFIPSLPSTFPHLQVLLHQPPSWWLQPVHNLFLLIASETGLVGLLLFLIIFHFLLIRSLSLSTRFCLYAFLAILLTGSLDHYWLTLQQTQLLFSIVIGLSLPKLLQ